MVYVQSYQVQDSRLVVPPPSDTHCRSTSGDPRVTIRICVDVLCHYVYDSHEPVRTPDCLSLSHKIIPSSLFITLLASSPASNPGPLAFR
jgi:hypothetical protein